MGAGETGFRCEMMGWGSNECTNRRLPCLPTGRCRRAVLSACKAVEGGCPVATYLSEKRRQPFDKLRAADGVSQSQRTRYPPSFTVFTSMEGVNICGNLAGIVIPASKPPG